MPSPPANRPHGNRSTDLHPPCAGRNPPGTASRPETRCRDGANSTYREAVRAAITDAMLRDDRVFMMGEDVGAYGGCYAVSKGLLAEFGPDRIRDTPLSESGFTGAGIGAAMAGMRPIVEIMTVNFRLLALDQIMNTAATIRHMSGGQFGCPRGDPHGDRGRTTACGAAFASS